jgi:beta-galactosidase
VHVREGCTAPGVAYYCSAGLDQAGLATIVRTACADAAVRPVADVPTGIAACRRFAESGSYLFLLNHTEHEVEVEVSPTAELVLGELPLPPLGVAVVREP